MDKTFTYYVWYLEDEGGDGLCYTKNFKSTPYKQIVFQFNEMSELVDYLVRTDDEWNIKGTNLCKAYVMDMYRTLINF